LWGLAQVAWNDACCLARSCEPLDQSNGLCFRPKWTSRPPDPAFSGIPGPKKLDIQQTFPVGLAAVPTQGRRVAPAAFGNGSGGRPTTRDLGRSVRKGEGRCRGGKGGAEGGSLVATPSVAFVLQRQFRITAR